MRPAVAYSSCRDTPKTRDRRNERIDPRATSATSHPIFFFFFFEKYTTTPSEFHEPSIHGVSKSMNTFFRGCLRRILHDACNSAFYYSQRDPLYYIVSSCFEILRGCNYLNPRGNWARLFQLVKLKQRGWLRKREKKEFFVNFID